MITFLYAQSSQQLLLDLLSICFLMVPILLSMIDSELTKSLIGLSCLSLRCLPLRPPPIIPRGDLVIRQNHILVIYVGVKCSDELQMWILQILPC